MDVPALGAYEIRRTVQRFFSFFSGSGGLAPISFTRADVIVKAIGCWSEPSNKPDRELGGGHVAAAREKLSRIPCIGVVRFSA